MLYYKWSHLENKPKGLNITFLKLAMVHSFSLCFSCKQYAAAAILEPDMSGRMLKAPPNIPLTYIYW